MGYSNGIISQPVSIHDVQRCVPVSIQRTNTSTGQVERRSSGDVGVLCSAVVGDTVPAMDGNGSWTVTSRIPINMWASRKPIYSPKKTPLTEDDWKGSAHTLSGFKTGGGIKKAIVTGLAYLNDAKNNSGNVSSAVWSYDNPRADGICFFRLTDFAGYYHTAAPTFSIERIYGNISNIIVPTSNSREDLGSTIGFSMKCRFTDGAVAASQLFKDCYTPSGNIQNYFYPGVIMTCAGDDKLNYVKTAANPISYYMNNTVDTVIEFQISTRLFMDKMTTLWSNKHSGDPYGSFPFSTGSMWTACLVLVSRKFDGGVDSSDSSYSGGYYTLSDSDNIIRLEYAAPTDNVYVDRKTLPLKQSKFNIIEWMKASVTIQKYTSDRTGYDCYKIRSIVVTAKMLTAETISFAVNAQISAYIGVVIVPGYSGSGGSSVQADSYINPLTFSGTIGEVQKEFVPGSTQGNSMPETTFYIQQSASSGNHNCNIRLTFVHSTKGSFIGQFSFDVSGQQPVYSKESVLL